MEVANSEQRQCKYTDIIIGPASGGPVLPVHYP